MKEERKMRIVASVAGLTTACAIALCLCSAAAPALAQEPGGRVEEELRRTDEHLQRVAPVVRESDSERARELLEQALRVQGQAWEVFRSGRPAIALRLTREARDLGARALVLARGDRSLKTRAEQELERAARMLEHVREELGGSLEEPARRLLEEAAGQIERGRAHFAEQHYEVALRLAISAQRLIRQAGSLGPGPAGDSRVLRELERTDHLIERAAPLIRESGHEEAGRILDSAIELQAKAWEAYRAGGLRPALALTREARGLIHRALSIVRGPVDAERVMRTLEETGAILERAAEVVRSSGVDHALRLLEKAIEHQSRARRFLEEAKLRNALAETRVARRLGLRAIQLAEEGGAR
jgi:tetratricopeptide (TPR) repeat protein